MDTPTTNLTPVRDLAAEIGAQLKAARENKGFSYYYVWQKTGLPPATIKRIEEGKGRMTNMQRLASFLEVEPKI